MSNKKGEFIFYYYIEGSGNASSINLTERENIKTIQCKVITLDEYTEENKIRVDFIKCDVEGAELNGLLGMRRLIERNRPSLCISVYHRPEDMVTIPKLIVSWGLDYKLYLRNHEYNGFGTVLYARPQTHI